MCQWPYCFSLLHEQVLQTGAAGWLYINSWAAAGSKLFCTTRLKWCAVQNRRNRLKLAEMLTLRGEWKPRCQKVFIEMLLVHFHCMDTVEQILQRISSRNLHICSVSCIHLVGLQIWTLCPCKAHASCTDLFMSVSIVLRVILFLRPNLFNHCYDKLFIQSLLSFWNLKMWLSQC